MRTTHHPGTPPDFSTAPRWWSSIQPRSSTRRWRLSTRTSRRPDRTSRTSRRVEEGNEEPFPSGAQHSDERWWRDQRYLSVLRSRPASHVTRRRPTQQIRTEHDARRAVSQDERAVGKVIELGFVAELSARAELDALGM